MARNAAEREAVEPEELLDCEREFVGRALGIGCDAPVVGQRRVVEHPDERLGVSDVDGEQHQVPAGMLGWMSKAMSRAGAEWVSAPTDTKSAPAAA
jgi:hypothetical protein